MRMLIIIFLLGIISFLVRVAPLATPPRLRSTPLVGILGKQLPTAIMVLLFLQSLQFAKPFLPQLIGITATASMHFWKRQIVFSIIAGMTAYILGATYL